jgi:rRNA maturation endonuclease Nob1
VDADAQSPEIPMAQWLCRACGATYDSRRDDCRVCGSQMLERIPEGSAGSATELVESAKDRPGR